MVSPTSGVLNGEIQDKAQSTHRAGKTAQVKHEEEYATSIALERKNNQARPRPWPAPGQERYHHCGDFEGHRLAPALGAGLLRRGREEEAEADHSERAGREQAAQIAIALFADTAVAASDLYH